ncbi:MAG: hypothetical protein ACI4TZ_00380 [Christensenellales bacterium]
MLTEDDKYFMSNDEWYEFDLEKNILILTDKVPKNDPKINESYQEYLDEIAFAKRCRRADELLKINVDNDEEFEKIMKKLQ